MSYCGSLYYRYAVGKAYLTTTDSDLSKVFLLLGMTLVAPGAHSDVVLLLLAPRMDRRFICCFCRSVLVVAGLLRTGMVQKPDVTAGRDNGGPPR